MQQRAFVVSFLARISTLVNRYGWSSLMRRWYPFHLRSHLLFPFTLAHLSAGITYTRYKVSHRHQKCARWFVSYGSQLSIEFPLGLLLRINYCWKNVQFPSNESDLHRKALSCFLLLNSWVKSVRVYWRWIIVRWLESVEIANRFFSLLLLTVFYEFLTGKVTGKFIDKYGTHGGLSEGKWRRRGAKHCSLLTFQIYNDHVYNYHIQGISFNR